MDENGYKFRDVRIPSVSAWIETAFVEWEPLEYSLWDVVQFDGVFYTLISSEGFDNTKTPVEEDCWGGPSPIMIQITTNMS